MAAASSASPLPRPQGGSNAAAVPTLSKKTLTTQQKSLVEKLPTRALTASGAQSNTAPKSKKKKKRHSPFRIKVGCIVALRYRSGGNHLKRIGGESPGPSCSYAEVWTDPQPGRDEGLALIGRRVRCCFPKSVLSNDGASTRIVEGEVISLIEYEAQWHVQRQKRQQRELCFTAVELLVDRAILKACPFLQRADEDVDTSIMSSTEKKRQHFEDVIRGKNMVVVKVNLADASRISVDKETVSACKDLVAKWVIRKRIPISSNEGDNQKGLNAAAAHNGSSEAGKPPRKKKKSSKDPGKSATMYIGDKNDPQAEQERSWRWLAGRYDEMLLSSESGANRPPEQLSCGLVGEVIKVEPTASTTANGTPTTLATVTLKRMILPEHLISGRISHHGPVDMFDDADARGKDVEYSSSSSTCTFQVPVEECVIISRKFERKHDATNGDTKIGSGLACPVVTRSYSYRSDSYRRLTSSDTSNDVLVSDETTVDVCHRCRKAEKKGTMERMKSLSMGKDGGKLTCHECQAQFRKSPYAKATSNCDCHACSSHSNSVQEELFKMQVEKAFADSEENGSESTVALARSAARHMRPVDFDLPTSFMEFQSLPEPSEKPITVAKPKRGRKSPKRTVQKSSAAEKGAAGKKSNSQPGSAPRRLVTKVEHVEHIPHQPLESKPEQEEEKVFVPSCSRLIPYDPMRKHVSGSPKRQMRMDNDSSSNQAVRPLEGAVGVSTAKQASRKRTREPERVVENKSTSRAARADQRRLKRGVAALGASSIGLDALAGREQQLRFDRSSIHAWGVFADEDINAGDMVVEYRGELIGNAMAEKREIEYEKAKIGSDYMFRIDGFMVCDATKQGNVARFINASCDPNCYTQIITLNGNKRIVIYAKRDIKAGEELCYDYKFPFEYDESKRIPCHCGAQDCRGFMNWDKRYVSLPPANTNTGAGHENTS